MSHQEPTLGRNRTGIQMSPIQSKQMIEGVENFEWDEVSTLEEDPDMLEMDYLESANPLGSIPIPMTVKGMAKSGYEMLKGERPEILVDKLGERLAFERSGVRLYDGLIRKCLAENTLSRWIDMGRLEHIRNEELQHMFLIKKTMESLGADPTAVTPCADAMSMASMGLFQLVNDPRTSLSQCLEAILTAELVDNDGWRLLIDLARDMGETNMAQDFVKAMEAEETHLRDVRLMLRNMILDKAGMTSEPVLSADAKQQSSVRL